MDYIIFDLEINAGRGSEYQVRVVRSPAGEARETMLFPFDKLALENRLKDLQIAILSSDGLARRRIPAQYEETVQRFGTEMFTALFVGEVRNRYDICQELAYQQRRGVRIRLSIHPPELAMLPWEFLYDTRVGDYVCLAKDTSLVRYLELPHPLQPLSVASPLQILVMIVSPTDLVALDVELEKQCIEQALEPLQRTGLVKITWLEGQTWRDLRNTLFNESWHVFHFVGHGGFDLQHQEGLIVLADPEKKPHYFTATEFGRLLADHHALRLVILNTCEGARSGASDVFSSIATTLVQRGIPAVVAMQYAISDIAAIEFAHTFYKTLASGIPVDVALSEARKAISFEIKNSLEWGIPVLYMRTMEGSIFTVESRPGESEVIHTDNAAILSVKDQQVRGIYRDSVWTQWNLFAYHRTSVTILLLLSITILFISYSAVTRKFIFTTPETLPESPTPSAFGLTVTPMMPIAVTAVISTETRINRKDNASYVLIPSGEFVMGTNDGEFVIETGEKIDGPEHTVDLTEFWIKKTEVTNQEYYRCFVAGACTKPYNNQWLYEVVTYPRYPVVDVNWEQAQTYAKWLGGRLPTEAEWEKSCRGIDKRIIYPWGNELPVNEFGQVPNLTKGEVGRFPQYASQYGVLDLIGNVAEWTNSIWGEDIGVPKFKYPYVGSDGREKLDDPGSMRVIRGATLIRSDDPLSGRCTNRYRDQWFNSNTFYGFRVVLDATFKW